VNERHATKPDSRATLPHEDWLGLAQASQLLGISGATLRRWADDGLVPVFTTPGGHRRFSRQVLQHLLPAQQQERPTLARLGASPQRLVRAYGTRGRSAAQAPRPEAAAWLRQLGDADRDVFRDRGRRLVGLLIEYLDAPGDAAASQLQQASRLAAEHGRQSAELGASMEEAVQGFLQFRAPFLAELAAIARRRALDTSQATKLLEAAEAAMDQLLLATMTGHSLVSAGRVARRRSRGGASPATAEPMAATPPDSTIAP